MKNAIKNKSVKPVPEGFHTVTPYIVVKDASSFIDFVKNAFNAKQTFLMKDDHGLVMHATVSIGDSLIMISDFMENMQQQQTAMLYLYLDDVDTVYRRAINAKATSVHEPTDEFYGDRAGAVKDAWGNVWWIATHTEDVSQEDLKERAQQAASERKEKSDEVHA